MRARGVSSVRLSVRTAAMACVLALALLVVGLFGAGSAWASSTDVSLTYGVHVQTYGWSYGSNDDATTTTAMGTTGQSKRLEAIQLAIDSELSGSITYRVHCQTYGWTDWVSDGETAGTTGESKRLEAIQIELTGELAEYYDVYYRVHIQTYGWTDWACNGEACGSGGLSKRMEAIEIVLVAKGGDAPGDTEDTYYASWLVEYYSHAQTYGWLSWVYDGALSGTTGQSKRLEAIQIKLTGELAEYYDVYYRVHVQTYGWTGWACNGETCGSTGLSKRMEAIEIVLVKKGEAAPGSTANTYFS